MLFRVHATKNQPLKSASYFLNSLFTYTQRATQESSAQCNNKDPYWTDELDFHVGDNFARLRFEVIDLDTFNGDDFIFGGEIDVTSIKETLEDKTKNNNFKVMNRDVDELHF